MPIYHHWKYECPLMMQEGAFVSLTVLMDSFLLIRRVNLVVHLIASSNMIGSQPGSGLLCLTVYTDLMKDSSYRTIGCSRENSTILQSKNTAQIINDGAVRKITTYALEHADEKGIRTSLILWPSFRRCLSKVTPVCWLLSLNFLGKPIKCTFTKHLVWLHIKLILVNLPINNLYRSNSSILAQKCWCVVVHIQYPWALGIY